MTKFISRKGFRRASAAVMSAAVLITTVGMSDFSGLTAEASEETVTLNILHKGPKPDGWDAVYEEYLARTKDTLNIELNIEWVEHADYKEKLNLEITSGSDWDLVYDASWIQLKNLAPEGYYADLSEYFNNDEYPGLQAAFSEDTMEANTWFGSMCYIPLAETYGNGIPVVWYRKDWAKEWGIGTDGQINSYDELVEYWQCALDNGLIAYGATQSRGFFQLMSVRGEAYEGSAQAGIQSISSGGLTFWIYSEDGELVDIAVQGSGDEAFANFPEGWNYDFGVERYETFAEWQEAGYIDPDSLSKTDSNVDFEAGLTASVIGTLDDYSDKMSYTETWGDEDALGYFVYVDSIRNMEEEAIPTNREGNNGWAVPATSTKIEYTMKFLDWLFGSQENHDLFQLGIEGVDFEYGEEEGTYTLLSTYADDLGGYSFTWNPTYAMQSTIYDEETLAYREYEYSDEAFISYPILGFHFDTSDVDLSTSVAQCKAVTDKISTVILHGIKTDGDGNTYDTMTEMIQGGYGEWRTGDPGRADRTADRLSCRAVTLPGCPGSTGSGQMD
ncbi:MAG: ABC transporter substrate-binding protein [Clostridiales bacterium]|nr:ABC transporter substrate-binding protein [Clostridiales bacterium]